MSLLTTDAQARDVLAHARTVAVLGAHPDMSRPAGYVTAYLVDAGYAVTPVNPAFAGTPIAGALTRADLGGLGPVDILVVFRRAEALPGHLPEVLAMRPAPRTVWFQLGIRHDTVAAALSDAGMDVVQSRCTLADHRAFGLPVVAR